MQFCISNKSCLKFLAYFLLKKSIILFSKHTLLIKILIKSDSKAFYVVKNDLFYK